jgi:hypothetical protein
VFEDRSTAQRRSLIVTTAIAGCSLLGLVGCGGTPSQSAAQAAPPAPVSNSAEPTAPTGSTTELASDPGLAQARVMLQTYYAAVLKEHVGSAPVLMVTYFAPSAVLEEGHHDMKSGAQPGDRSRGAYCSGRQAPSGITVGRGTRRGDLATFSTVTDSVGGNTPVPGSVTVNLSTVRITGWSCPS